MVRLEARYESPPVSARIGDLADFPFVFRDRHLTAVVAKIITGTAFNTGGTSSATRAGVATESRAETPFGVRLGATLLW